MSEGSGGEAHRGVVAPFGARVLARAIDLVIVSTVIVLLAGSATTDDDGNVSLPRWVVLVTASVFVVYETAMVASRGQTVGKMATKIRLVDARTGRSPSVASAAVRGLVVVVAWPIVGPLGLLVMIVLYLTAAFDRDTGRGIPDRLAGTAVVLAD